MEGIGEHTRSRSGFVLVETLKSIKESRAGRHVGNRDQYRALSRSTRALVRYVRGLVEDDECH